MLITLNEMIQHSIEKFRDLPALKIREGDVFKPISYGRLGDIIRKLGTALIDIGIKKGDHIGLISDNRFEWMMCDLAILGTGACDVPRGSDTTPNELEYIIKHAEIKISFVEDRRQLQKIYAIAENLPRIKTLIVIDPEGLVKEDFPLIEIYTMDELIKRGESLIERGDNRFEQAWRNVKSDDLATIIYTSGTTGQPKGVMLLHKNIMHNVLSAPYSIPVTSGDKFLSILPTWHSFERTIEYVLLHVGASNAYSKPAAQILMKDLELEKPNYIASVPRIWESIYNAVHYKISRDSIIKRAMFFFFVKSGVIHHKMRLLRKNLLPVFETKRITRRFFEVIFSSIIELLLKPITMIGDKLVYSKIREKTGGQLKAGISGGGALQRHVDDFFAGINLTILEGYGLTETSPIVAVRTFERPVLYTVGQLLRGVQVKIVDDNGNEVPRGQKGIIMVKGDLVMKGYYKNEKATREVLSPDGWLNTGDIGRLTVNGELQITGRAKDTIVLLGGENIEPLPIELALSQSRYIHEAMVVGQDKKTLGALIIPEYDNIVEYAEEHGIEYKSIEDLLKKQEIKNLIRSEIREFISPKYGFRTVEYISNFVLLPDPFEIGRELTHTLKKRRNIIYEMYHDYIEAIYGR